MSIISYNLNITMPGLVEDETKLIIVALNLTNISSIKNPGNYALFCHIG